MLDKGVLETRLVESPVEYSVLRAGNGPSVDLPIVLWLHGGGGSSRFLETCQAQFVTCWNESSLPDLIAVTPTAGWSSYLDDREGVTRWESFLVDELVADIRKRTGSSNGPLVVGGISAGATAALRLAFRRPELVRCAVAIEPTLETGSGPDTVPLRDRVHLPPKVRAKLWGQPADTRFWRTNNPLNLAVENAGPIVAAGMAIYIECGDRDLIHAHFGAEALHRTLFDAGISHEYRLVQGANHVGPTVGPRVVDALRFIGKAIKPEAPAFESIDAMVEVETFANQVRELELAAGYRSTERIEGPACPLTVHLQGEGQPIVLLPALGRGADDFSALADRLAASGYRVIRPEPRGVGGSSRSLDGLVLDDFADDVASVVDTYGAPAVLVGHDFGGHVAQLVSCLHPELVDGLVLLAAPGPVPAKPEPSVALRRIFVPELTDEEHLEAIALALFAPGNDPVAWVDGWHPMLAFAQAEAERHVPPEGLWDRLRGEALVIQPTEDRIVMPENSRLMAERLGARVRVVDIPNAGHALLPEQPDAVAAAILSWLGQRRRS